MKTRLGLVGGRRGPTFGGKDGREARNKKTKEEEERRQNENPLRGRGTETNPMGFLNPLFSILIQPKYRGERCHSN